MDLALNAYESVATPEPGPTQLASPNRHPEDVRFISFILHFITVVTRIPGPTRMEDPNRSPVYSDIFIYLIETFY